MFELLYRNLKNDDGMILEPLLENPMSEYTKEYTLIKNGTQNEKPINLRSVPMPMVKI